MTTTVSDRRSSEGVTSERVEFQSEGETLVGDLFRPAERDVEQPLPGLVVTGSWTTVKEQMAGLYARRLAQRGYATFAFDFRHYGESGGAPRDLELPAEKAADIGNAVGHLAAARGVDAERLASVAVCASAGYAAVNAAGNERIRSLVLIAPWLHDGDLVRELYGGEEGVRERIEGGERAHERYRQTGEVEYVPAVSTTDQSAAMFGEFDYYLNGERGRIPEWSDRFAVMAWPGWLEFDPIRIAPRISQPTLLVHSEKAAVPEGARRFEAAITGPSSIEWIDGIQFDFYDQEPNVSRATEAADAHLRRTLALER